MEPTGKISSAPARRFALRAEAERAVVRWEWATWSRHTIEPHYFERNCFAPGKPIATPPRKPRDGMRAYGFDADGRLVLAREHTAWPGLTKDTYWIYRPDGVEQWHYDKEWGGKAPIIHVGWFALRAGKIASSTFACPHSPPATTRYTWKGGLLRRAVGGERDERFEYDRQGALTRITQNGIVTFVRVVPGRTLDDLAPALRAELEAAIRSRLAKLRADEPVRAVAVVLDEENDRDLLPPLLGVPTVSERDAQPADWERFDVPAVHYATRRLLDLCETINQDIWQHERHRAAIALVAEVVAALDARPPTGRGWRRAPRFAVYLTDLETGRRKRPRKPAARRRRPA